MGGEGASELRYEGCNYLRQRLILATLSGKRIVIKNIRQKDDDPGLREFEASFIRLLDKITNGSTIEVNETGTRLLYDPGLLLGGRLEHDCSVQRSIGYFLEPLACLAPFCKHPLEAVLRGVTNDHQDPSVDAFKQSTLPLLKRFLEGFVDDSGFELRVVGRGMAPGGGGEVVFRCPIRKQLRAIQWTDHGKIKRVRGVAYAVRVSPTTANRMVEAAKGVLLRFLPDVYIHTDHCRGSSAGRSPGFGLCLVAESTTGVFLSAEACSCPSGGEREGMPNVAEDIGIKASHELLEEIFRGGCFDSSNQSLACLFMALGPQDVSKGLSGPLSPYTIQFLRHLKDVFQVMFKLDSTSDRSAQKEPEEEAPLAVGAEKVLLTCVGVGFTNISKKTM